MNFFKSTTTHIQLKNGTTTLPLFYCLKNFAHCTNNIIYKTLQVSKSKPFFAYTSHSISKTRVCKWMYHNDVWWEYTPYAIPPGFHGRVPGSTQWDSLGFGWWDPRCSHWCRGPAGPTPRWCCRKCSRGIWANRKRGCTSSCCLAAGGNSETQTTCKMLR